MIFRYFKQNSAEERYVFQESLKAFAIAVSFCLFSILVVYFLWDMPQGSQGHVVWNFSIVGLACAIIMVMLLGPIALKHGRSFWRSPCRLELSGHGLHDGAISTAPIPWSEIKGISAHPISPNRLAKQTSRGAGSLPSGRDIVLIVQLSESGWKSGTIRKLHRDKRQSLVRTFGVDGISIHPSSYGRDADELKSALEKYKARFG